MGSIVGANLAAFTAELGGKVSKFLQLRRRRLFIVPQAPIVIFNDADLISAVNGAAFASFIASGQTCVSGTRIIVQDDIYDRFMSLFIQKTDRIRSRIGDRRLALWGDVFQH